MRRFALCLSAACLSAACLIAACGSPAKVSTPGSTSTSVPTRSTRVLRGTAVGSFECRPQQVSSGVGSIPINAVQTLLLCPLSTAGAPTKPVTLGVDRPTFTALIAALAAADEPPTPGAVCPLYADLLQVVVAKTSDGVYQVSIPTDACRHYLRGALDALNRARGT